MRDFEFDFLKNYRADLRSNSKYLVFIDDTGSPGGDFKCLPADRNTWVAVLIPPLACSQVYDEFLQVWVDVCHRYGCSELHFKEIFQGQGPFRDISWDERMEIFERVIDIFEKNDLRILVQSMEPGQIAKWHSQYGIDKEAHSHALFDVDAPKDFSLLVLLVRISCLIRESRSADSIKARVFCDEGWKRTGLGIELKPMDRYNVFEDASLLFVRSTTIIQIQMADCAAYILNKWQQLWGREKLKGFEMNFLGRVERLAPYFEGRFGIVELHVDDKTLHVISGSYRDENSEA
jgi:hypothetical protein